ncbi:prephenate dehydrogenase [Candidatus Falkowbacteria bacterium CG11_big_fil_rev_8_21_14_0_20_39_10]|uniref:Prephenate dehydrogenase n=1 Tax=Candidatus Falkowbacteria bacterium CG11_big_fil_rev_8_21_14_0_20_39_10 TaxID=1974570 RepID=A0A2M6K8Q4_9BACT|nr:MAG: prephenate dehydrogenase [Candidatus Falkowbacteria bacterium CG11_big_fil_rev_8_21_14_0_20_39_10]
MDIKKNKTTIGIIGFGRFGALAASILSRHFLVKVYHYKNKKENPARAKKIGVRLTDLKDTLNSDIVILIAPISQTEKIIKEIAPQLKPGCLVMDACSVKVYPCQWLKKHLPKSVEIMGTHPMFGPTTSKYDFDKQTWDLKKLQIVLCPLRIKKIRLEKIKKFLKKLDLKVIITTPDDHDRQNAKTLSLVHFVGRSILGAGIGQQKIYTPGYEDLLRILPHTTSDNWQLFYDMNNYNPYAQVIRENFLDSCQTINKKINAFKKNQKN